MGENQSLKEAAGRKDKAKREKMKSHCRFKVLRLGWNLQVSFSNLQKRNSVTTSISRWNSIEEYKSHGQ